MNKETKRIVNFWSLIICFAVVSIITENVGPLIDTLRLLVLAAGAQCFISQLSAKDVKKTIKKLVTILLD